MVQESHGHLPGHQLLHLLGEFGRHALGCDCRNPMETLRHGHGGRPNPVVGRTVPAGGAPNRNGGKPTGRRIRLRQTATAWRSARPTVAFSLGGTSTRKRLFQLSQSARIAAALALPVVC